MTPCMPALSSYYWCNSKPKISDDDDSSFSKLYNISITIDCCNTTNCNIQSGYCLTTQFVADSISTNYSSQNVSDLIISESCSSRSDTPIATVTLLVSVKVNLVYISAYNNLTSNESLTLIANFKSFVGLMIAYIYLYVF